MDHRASLPSRAPSQPAPLRVDDVHGAIRMVATGLARQLQLSGVAFDRAEEDACQLRARLARVEFLVERSGGPLVAVVIGPLTSDDPLAPDDGLAPTDAQAPARG